MKPDFQKKYFLKIEPILKSVILKLALAVFRQKPYETAPF
jgi:hypothetical protein